MVEDTKTIGPEAIQEFFNKVDLYLIKDLQTLVDIKVMKGGSAAYPCLQTIISGMELMGLVLSGEKKDVAYYAFWNRLGQYKEIYTPLLGEAIRDAARNGIAHYFLTKTGILVHLRKSDLHLKVTKDKQLFISCYDLFNDFLYVYEEIKKELLSGNVPNHLKVLLTDRDYGKFSVDKYYNSLKIEDSMFNRGAIIPPALTNRLFFDELLSTGVSHYFPNYVIVSPEDKKFIADAS